MFYQRIVLHRIAIYDLDRTVLATPTFTAFLLFSARRLAPWRLALAPLWFLAMAGHALKFYDRNRLKPMGISLLLGSPVDAQAMQKLAAAFAEKRLPSDVQPGARAAMERDRSEGFRLILATAAPEFYACCLGEKLGFEAVLATTHEKTASGDWLAQLKSKNCHGMEKRRRVDLWLADQSIFRSDAHIRFYSDDISDAPTLALADEGYAINPDRRFAKAAHQSGWAALDFAQAAPDYLKR